jgi:hypothetical protein
MTFPYHFEFNNSCNVGLNITKSAPCTPTHQGLSQDSKRDILDVVFVFLGITIQLPTPRF